MAPHRSERALLVALLALAAGACVVEGRRAAPDSKDAADGDVCESTCATDFPAPPACMVPTWDAEACTCSLVASGLDAPCDDGDACTSEDRCTADGCVGEALAEGACADDNDCTSDACDPAVGCTHDPVGAGEPCDDGNVCTFDSRCDAAGRCGWDDQYVCGQCDPLDDNACAEENLQQDLCDGRLACVQGYCQVERASAPRCPVKALDPCLVPGCDDGTCTATPLPDDTPCSDRSSCTRGDTCQDGTCTGTPVDDPACACARDEDCAPLDDGDLCNGVFACVSERCVFDFASIVEPDTRADTPCSTTTCDPTSGAPMVVVADDDAPCDDGDPCTPTTTCQAGACVGPARDCSQFDGRCLVGVCDRVLGCTAAVAPPESACVRDEPCTQGARCNDDGDCVPPLAGCDDDDACTVDYCDAKSDACQHVGPDKPDCGAMGVCAGGVPLGCELGEYVCDYGAVAGWSAVERCDGRDDDCDGATDEACIADEACAAGHLLGAWSGTMQACTGPTDIAAAACGAGWHVCSYSAMVESLAGDAPPAGYLIAASIAFDPIAGYRVVDRPGDECFEFSGVCTNQREVQAMSWDGVFGATVAYAAEAWGCDNGLPASDCATVQLAGVMCCADACDGDADCADDSPCTIDRCIGGRCENLSNETVKCPSLGVCEGVEPVCRPNGSLVCDLSGVVGHEAVEATCDGLDNDCDGATDADDPGFDPQGQRCELQVGVCEGADRGASACVDGAWNLCGAADYGARSSAYEDAFEARCDGLDNNCDGTTDGGFGWRGAALGAACDGEGACGGGVVECGPSRGAATCSTNADGSASEAVAERCNGADDDCDGDTDEAAELDASTSPCGSAGVCLGLPVARCVAGAWQCDTAGVPGFGAETCDGLDNDCDGETDEGFASSDGLALGASCGPAACQHGVVVCAPDGEAAACSSDLGGEVCDGVDNDCDGQTDEGLLYNDATLGARALGQSCSGRGACGPGTVVCVDLRAACSSIAGDDSAAAIESCNGVDDDCDGATDEGFRWQGSALGAACEGLGACGGGVVQCALDHQRATCSTMAEGAASQAHAERCNGIDDDCDGATDEGAVAGAEDCPVEGVCRLEMVNATCHGGDGWECDYSGNPYYSPADEVALCDRLDNDCDGKTDEDFPELGQACDGDDGDACARGTWACDPNDATQLVCVGDHASAERCNGEDDDCDGATDELDAAGCTTFRRDHDHDGWGTVESRCACAAGDEFTATAGGDCDDADADTHPEAPETCDGHDDDCDGKTDAGDAADLVVDDVEPCELTAGVCAGTAKNANRCVAGAWQPCQAADYLARNAAYQTKETRCDGLDNDCNGATDAADDNVAASPPLCELQLGPCAGAKKPLSSCTADGWAACSTATYTAWNAAYEPGWEVGCDGLDNDCDGTIDDDFTFGGKAVGLSCDGTGACGVGLVQCAADGSRATCSTNPDGAQHQDQPEACNGVDDDCDGQTDDGLGLAQSSCKKVGVCAAGGVVATCADGAWSCNYAAVDDYESPSEASCDERDNDCDGQTDEDLRMTVDGQILKKGDPCGEAGCSGAVVCNAATPAPGDLVCSSEIAGGAEVCDGLDNDCDGDTDEGLGYTTAAGQFLPLAAACDGDGACGAGVVECNAAHVAVCSTNPDGTASQATAETCNGVDDDCDRAIDDGFAWHDRAVGQACDGTGECGAGTVVCIADGAAATCSTDPDGPDRQDLDEVCNGLDDDCDGLTDEDLGLFDSDCLLEGVCTADRVQATCAGAAGWACDYTGVPGYHEGDEQGYCDGLDNDCDGDTDEDYPEVGDACDLPNDPDLCAKGTWTCGVNATPVGDPAADREPVCSGDTPSPETCAAGDEDCDGASNEEGAQGCQVYFKDVDGDGFGRQHDFKCLCAAGQVAFYTAQSPVFDCDDGDKAIHPGATESCNEVDDDCDNLEDEDGATGCGAWFYDGDDDGYGVTSNTRCLCWDWQGDATGHTTQLDGDCKDSDDTIHPGAPELCDDKDNDCDGKRDDKDPPVVGCDTWYFDQDQDAWGLTGNSQCRCQPGDKYEASLPGDCCDSDVRALPQQTAWFSQTSNCQSWDFNCSGQPELELPSYGGCDCGAVLGLCTTTCTYTSGWAVRVDAVGQPIPACGATGRFVSGCSSNACEPIVTQRNQRCH